MIKAVFPGSFDPPTLGHRNLLKRAAHLFDSLDVVVAYNHEKKYLLEPEQRVQLVEKMVYELGLSNVKVYLWDKLVVDYARENGIKVIVRGVRALSDFNYEFELSMINKGLYSDIETVFLPTDSRYFVLRSSVIKELLRFGGDISAMVPPYVEEILLQQTKGY